MLKKLSYGHPWDMSDQDRKELRLLNRVLGDVDDDLTRSHAKAVKAVREHQKNLELLYQYVEELEATVSSLQQVVSGFENEILITWSLCSNGHLSLYEDLIESDTEDFVNYLCPTCKEQVAYNEK